MEITLVASGHPKRDIPPRARYLLKNIHAASASRRTVITHRDESLNPVFLAMVCILTDRCGSENGPVKTAVRRRQIAGSVGVCSSSCHLQPSGISIQAVHDGVIDVTRR